MGNFPVTKHNNQVKKEALRAPITTGVMFLKSMHYTDGKEVKLGDLIRFADRELGEVVFSLDTNEFSVEFPMKEWEYLKRGVMVRMSSGNMFHFTDFSNEEAILESRANET